MRYARQWALLGSRLMVIRRNLRSHALVRSMIQRCLASGSLVRVTFARPRVPGHVVWPGCSGVFVVNRLRLMRGEIWRSRSWSRSGSEQ